MMITGTQHETGQERGTDPILRRRLHKMASVPGGFTDANAFRNRPGEGDRPHFAPKTPQNGRSSLALRVSMIWTWFGGAERHRHGVSPRRFPTAREGRPTKKIGIAGLVAVVLVLGASAAHSADSPNDHLKLTTDRVVVFKDGYYLALKSGTAVTNKDGELTLLDVPDGAVLGSVWA